MKITQATAADIDEVAESYEKLFDYYETHPDTTLWKRGVYPSRAWAETGVANGWLYVMRDEEGNFGASCFWNQVQGKEYKDQPWRYPAKDSEVMVGHTLCVLPGVKRHGIGRAFVEFGMELGRKKGCKVMRFDTHIDNIPASHLYENMGFRLVSTGPAILNGLVPVTLRYYEKKL